MYTLHVISLKFTGNPCKISPKISLLHGFPTSNAGNPKSIPVKQIPCKYYNGNQSVDFSKLQGLQVYMQSPWWLHACYREHFATQGFPALFMGKTFAVYLGLDKAINVKCTMRLQWKVDTIKKNCMYLQCR